MMKCPKCAKELPEGLLECTFCGIIFEKWKARKQKSLNKKPKNSEENNEPSFLAMLAGFAALTAFFLILGWYGINETLIPYIKLKLYGIETSGRVLNFKKWQTFSGRWQTPTNHYAVSFRYKDKQGKSHYIKHDGSKSFFQNSRLDDIISVVYIPDNPLLARPSNDMFLTPIGTLVFICIFLVGIILLLLCFYLIITEFFGVFKKNQNKGLL